MIHTFDDLCQLLLYRLLRKCCGPVDYFTIKSQIARNAQTFPKDSQPSALGDGSQLLSPTRATKHHPKTKAAWHGWHSMTTCTKTSKRGLLLVCPRNILIVYSYGDLGGIWRCLVRGNMYIYIRIYSYYRSVVQVFKAQPALQSHVWQIDMIRYNTSLDCELIGGDSFQLMLTHEEYNYSILLV